MNEPLSIAGLAVPPGERASGFLPVDATPGGSILRVPLLAANGVRPGPTVLATTGVHGDDLTTVPVIWEVARRLDPQRLAGRWIGVPVANPPAFDAGSHLTPQDHKSLAFPGRREGTLSERMAAALADHLLAPADYVVDMHGGSVRSTLAVLAMVEETGGRTQEAQEAMARAFDPDVIIRKPPAPDGPRSLTGEANARGIPGLVIGMGRFGFDPAFTARGTHGVLNILRLLGLLEGDPELTHSPLEAGVEVYHLSPASGAFLPAVRAGEIVAEGAVLGTVVDIFGTVVAEVRTRTGGVVDAIRYNPILSAGEWVASVAPVRR